MRKIILAVSALAIAGFAIQAAQQALKTVRSSSRRMAIVTMAGAVIIALRKSSSSIAVIGTRARGSAFASTRRPLQFYVEPGHHAGLFR